MLSVTQNLVRTLCSTACQRIIIKIESDDSVGVPAYVCVDDLTKLAGSIANLYGRIDGATGVCWITGPADVGYTFAGGNADDNFPVQDKMLMVSVNRHLWIQARVKHSGETFETDSIDFEVLLRELQNDPGESLFLGDWDEDEDEDTLAELAARGIEMPCYASA